MKSVDAIPFNLLFVEKVDPSLYYESIKNAGILKESYNPETQTSNPLIYDGTATTTITTTTGTWLLLSVDDVVIDDT